MHKQKIIYSENGIVDEFGEPFEAFTDTIFVPQSNPFFALQAGLWQAEILRYIFPASIVMIPANFDVSILTSGQLSNPQCVVITGFYNKRFYVPRQSDFRIYDFGASPDVIAVFKKIGSIVPR